jgi:uncharacterized protein YaeQ
MYTFDVELADVDRQVYASLSLRVARHPSETDDHLLARLLAYCLEYTEGISFGAGLAEPDAPSVAVRDLTGAIRSWIDIGAPDAARLHRASKASPRVAVYTHKDPRQLLRQLAGARIHRAEAIELYAIDPEFLAELAGHVDRRTALTLSVTDRHLFIGVRGATLSSAIVRHYLKDDKDGER